MGTNLTNDSFGWTLNENWHPDVLNFVNNRSIVEFLRICNGFEYFKE